ncbi:MAG: hypothetical protein CVV18_07690 [Gammaproteobacteria bacterium HGW-Gammaproteobacteria-8]|nr:MAG: hypothetical protein CVV18_07690 [Gammaproteobacteria bacterium HGW-Gammaproteobacteria-8]
MDTFARVVEFADQRFDVVHRDKFLIALEIPTSGERHQSVFLAEIKDDDDRRYLRLETTVAPLAQHDPVKLLRINLTLRVGYLAVGDLEGIPFLKLCENIAYRYLSDEMLYDEIHRIARMGDDIEKMLVHGGDWF